MEGVDKEKVQKVIYEMSKGSKYFENEQRKEALIKQKIENLQQQHAKLTDEDIAYFQKVPSPSLGPIRLMNFFGYKFRWEWVPTHQFFLVPVLGQKK